MAKECPLYKTAHKDRYGLLKGYAKFNRHNMTWAEEKLWKELRRGKQGTKFRRQYIIGDYIADFVCLEHNLIIELDGECHEGEEQREKDKVRQSYLESLGYTVIRFTNEMATNNIEQVLKTINKHVFPDLPFAEVIETEQR